MISIETLVLDDRRKFLVLYNYKITNQKLSKQLQSFD